MTTVLNWLPTKFRHYRPPCSVDSKYVERLKPLILAHENRTKIEPCSTESSELFEALDYIDKRDVDELMPTVTANRVALRLEPEFVIRSCVWSSWGVGGKLTHETARIFNQAIEDLIYSSAPRSDIEDEIPCLDHYTWTQLEGIKQLFVSSTVGRLIGKSKRWRKLRVVRDLIFASEMNDDELASTVVRFLSPAECLVAACVFYMDGFLAQDNYAHSYTYALLLKGIWGISPGFSWLMPINWKNYCKIAVSKFIKSPCAPMTRIPVFDGSIQSIPACFREAKEFILGELSRQGLVPALAKIVCLFVDI